MEKYDVIIAGSGPAGLTAAIYNARSNLKTLVLAGIKFGGQLMDTTLVENYPGFVEGIMGPELMGNMMKQAERYGAKIIYKNVTSVDFSDLKAKKVSTEEATYEAKAVIITTGASPRLLDVPGEDKFYGRGVSTCATCDAAFYREKTVAVIGGGDTAMEYSSVLTKFAKKVYLVHRRDEFRASEIMQKRVLENPKVEILWNSEVKEVIGTDKVTGLKIANTQDKSEKTLDLDGVFLAIGNVPNTNFLVKHLDLDKSGYVVVDNQPFTKAEGVFVAGEISDHLYKQAVSSAGDGCKAALEAEKYIEMNAELFE